MLDFKDFELDAIDEVGMCLDRGGYDSCDYSIGGIYMWTEYFGYRCCIRSDTLFIECRRDGRSTFLLPCGAMPVADAVGVLKEHCRERGCPLQLSVVPEEALKELPEGFVAENASEWNDYLYDIGPLATYEGHALKNKRNRARKFETDCEPRFERVEGAGCAETLDFLKGYVSSDDGSGFFRAYENRQTIRVMEHPERYPFHTFAVRVGGAVRGVIVGETRHGVLFIHIEKSEKSFPGINESLFRAFVADRLRVDPSLRYVNREEDMGDEGLRRSKRSFCPTRILKKYTVTYE